MLKPSSQSLKKNLYVIKTRLVNETFIRKKNWPLNSCDLSLDYTFDYSNNYGVWDIMKTMVYKNGAQFSAVIIDAWDRQTKKSINNTIHQC